MKRFLSLDPNQVEELQRLLDQTDRVKIYRRLQFIQMKSDGKKNSEIQKVIPVSSDTLSNWLTLFLKGGFPWLCGFNYDGRRPWVLEKNKEAIKKHIDDEIVPTLTHLKAWILKELSISVQESWLGEWCKKNSIVLIRKWRKSQASSNPKKHKNIS